MKDKPLVDAIVNAPETAKIPPRERAIVDYAIKLTKTPGEMSEEDVQGLRDAGLDDVDISDVNAICAYFNMVNRISNGLGIEGIPALNLE